MSLGELRPSVSAMAVKLKPCLKHSTGQSMDVEQGLMCRGPNWRRFTQRLGEYGEGYTGPGYNPLRDRLLRDARQRLDTELQPFWDEAEYTGIVLMSDGWTDPNHRPLMNVLAATPKGTCFLFAENCEGHIKDANYIVKVWAKGMEQVGSSNVHYFLVDGAKVNMTAGTLLEEQ